MLMDEVYYANSAATDAPVQGGGLLLSLSSWY